MKALLITFPINAFRALGEATVKIKYLGTLADKVMEDKEWIAFFRGSMYIEDLVNNTAITALRNLQMEKGDVFYIITTARPIKDPEEVTRMQPEEIYLYKVVVE